MPIFDSDRLNYQAPIRTEYHFTHLTVLEGQILYAYFHSLSFPKLIYPGIITFVYNEIPLQFVFQQGLYYRQCEHDPHSFRYEVIDTEFAKGGFFTACHISNTLFPFIDHRGARVIDKAPKYILKIANKPIEQKEYLLN